MSVATWALVWWGGYLTVGYWAVLPRMSRHLTNRWQERGYLPGQRYKRRSPEAIREQVAQNWFPLTLGWGVWLVWRGVLSLHGVGQRHVLKRVPPTPYEVRQRARDLSRSPDLETDLAVLEGNVRPWSSHRGHDSG